MTEATRCSVYFRLGTNPDINTVNVQSRLKSAEPKIPARRENSRD